MLSKLQKKAILDYLEHLCNKTRFTNQTLGILFRGVHAVTPFNLLVGLFFCSFEIATLCAISLIMVFILFILFNGCFLSMLEKRLCKDNFTIADPFLELFNMDKTKENRVKISYVVIGCYMSVFFSVYYMRFYRN